jgi:capsular polysaccharide biosynthesis protein
MSEPALDMRRSLRIVRRHKRIVIIAAALGLLAGAAFTVLKPPLLKSEAQVVLPTGAGKYTATQAVIASSDPVLADAGQQLSPPMSVQRLRDRVQTKALTPNVIAITAEGTTGAQAQSTTNAVAHSYIAFIGQNITPGGQMVARMIQGATPATGTPLPSRVILFGGLGALLGALIGVIIALAIGRSDRRLRERDEIADTIGVPVLASIPVAHPSDAGGWTRLLDEYNPGAVPAWNLRKALQHLGLTDVKGGSGGSLAVLSLSSDPGALALGPQLAAFAASLGIPTALVIGPQQDANVTATLRAACAVPRPAQSKRPDQLRVSVRDQDDTDHQPDGAGDGRQPDAALTTVVAVVDAQTPRVADTIRTTATVLGVSAGRTTADQLARVAASLAADGRQIAGILVADPDSADHTTGRIPQLAPPSHRRLPTRLTGTTEGRK